MALLVEGYNHRIVAAAGSCRLGWSEKPLAKALLRNERHVEEVFYFRTSK